MSIFGRNKTGGYPFYLWVIRNGYPNDLQVMCMNCNMAKRIYGTCPHGNGIVPEVAMNIMQAIKDSIKENE